MGGEFGHVAKKVNKQEISKKVLKGRTESVCQRVWELVGNKIRLVLEGMMFCLNDQFLSERV